MMEYIQKLRWHSIYNSLPGKFLSSYIKYIFISSTDKFEMANFAKGYNDENTGQNFIKC